MFSKNVTNNKDSPKLIFFNEKKNLERFGQFLMLKIDFESPNFAIFNNFYASLHKTKKEFIGQ